MIMAQAQLQQQQQQQQQQLQKANPAADFGPDSGGRIKGLTIVKPLVYGNVARYFGKKREEDGHTHDWTVYVKPYSNEDMSTYVKKIHFKLHESYANQNRVLTKPPYEVTETGWGEFEIVIKIFFHDPNERPVTIYHILKLFQSPPGTTPATTANPPTTSAPPTTTTPTPATVLTATTTPVVTVSAAVGGDLKKPLVSEFYEELIFQDPSAMMRQLLTNTRQLTLGEYKHDTDFEEKKVKTIKNLVNAKEKISNEIVDLREKIKLAKDTVTKFKEEINKTQGEGAVDVSGFT